MLHKSSAKTKWHRRAISGDTTGLRTIAEERGLQSVPFRPRARFMQQGLSKTLPEELEGKRSRRT
ncbi:MAG: hypothetical protein VB140_01330 [Burkholderia sp.]